MQLRECGHDHRRGPIFGNFLLEVREFAYQTDGDKPASCAWRDGSGRRARGSSTRRIGNAVVRRPERDSLEEPSGRSLAGSESST